MHNTQRAASIVAVAVLAILSGCALTSAEDRLLAAIEADQGTNVQLTSVFEGRWDHFLILCPYDTDIGDRLGFTWDDAPDTTLSDTSQTIVLVQNERLVSANQISLQYIDACSSGIWALQTADRPLSFSKNGSGMWIAEQP